MGDVLDPLRRLAGSLPPAPESMDDIRRRATRRRRRRRRSLGTVAVVAGITVATLVPGDERAQTVHTADGGAERADDPGSTGVDPACDGRELATADLDGDGRTDHVYHEWIDDGSGGAAVLGVCTGSGIVASMDGLGQAELLGIIDVEPDGRDEILYGATSVMWSGTSVAILDGDRVAPIRTDDGAALLLTEGAVEVDELGEPTVITAIGCRDVVGDIRRELIQVTATFSGDGVRWTKEGYELEGAVATLVHSDSGSDAEPSDRWSYDPASLTDPCSPAAAPAEPAPPAADDGARAYLIGPSAEGSDLLLYEHLVAVPVPDHAVDSAERITVALFASARPTDRQRAAGLRPALSPDAVPEVTVDGDVAILAWSADGARRELAAWGTSSGSTGLNPIAGMVFENAPEVAAIENRVDGSCERFTEMMQGAGCDRDTRGRWEAYVTAGRS